MTTTPASPAGTYRYYVLVILVLVNTVNFIDRQAISVLGRSIQEEFQISNTLLGLVMGIAFTAFYATLGFPIARLADRTNRVRLLAGVITIWSGMTALCGAAASFAMLFLFRVGVGIGEAGAGPCSHSIIADYFEKKERPGAIGAFSIGVPLGIFLGIVIGGLLVEPLGWRWTFVVLGSPGVVLAVLLMLTIREPKRGGMDDPADAAALKAGEDIKLWDGIKTLWAIPTFRIMAFSAAPSSLCGYGMNLWIPGFLSRIHELPESSFAIPLGLATGVGGGLGALCGGLLTGRAARKDPRAFLTLPGYTMIAFAIALGVAVWTPNLTIAYLAILVAAFTQFYLMGPFFSVVQRLAPLRGRAVATAFFFFILSLVGLGIGPFYVGVLNDLFRQTYGDAEGLRLALTTLTGISVLAGLIAFLGRGDIARDLARTSGGSDAAAAPAWGT
jgi:MFS family permease